MFTFHTRPHWQRAVNDAPKDSEFAASAGPWQTDIIDLQAFKCANQEMRTGQGKRGTVSGTNPSLAIIGSFRRFFRENARSNPLNKVFIHKGHTPVK
jgi:hypothetical protein